MKNIRLEEAKCKERISGCIDFAAGYIKDKQYKLFNNGKEAGSTNNTETELFGGINRLGINHVFNG